SPSKNSGRREPALGLSFVPLPIGVGQKRPDEVTLEGRTRLMSSAVIGWCTEREPTYPIIAVSVGVSSRWTFRFQFMDYLRVGFDGWTRFSRCASMKMPSKTGWGVPRGRPSGVVAMLFTLAPDWKG